MRAAVDAWGLKLCAKEPKWHSDTVSAILVPEGIDSANVVKTAYYRYNTSLGVGLNKVMGKVFRIGHLGALDEVMVGGVLFAVEMALKDCGVPVKMGSGTGAAAEYFSKTATKSATSREAAEGQGSLSSRPAVRRSFAIATGVRPSGSDTIAPTSPWCQTRRV